LVWIGSFGLDELGSCSFGSVLQPSYWFGLALQPSYWFGLVKPTWLLYTPSHRLGCYTLRYSSQYQLILPIQPGKSPNILRNQTKSVNYIPEYKQLKTQNKSSNQSKQAGAGSNKVASAYGSLDDIGIYNPMVLYI
jgi:hypothetical protein